MTLAFVVEYEQDGGEHATLAVMQAIEAVTAGDAYRPFSAAYDALARAQELGRMSLQRDSGVLAKSDGTELRLLGLLGAGPCPALAQRMAQLPRPIARKVTAYDLAVQGQAFLSWQRSDVLMAQLSPQALAVLNRCVDTMHHGADIHNASLTNTIWGHYHEIAAVFASIEGVPPTAVLEMVANRRPSMARQAKCTTNFASVETIANYSSVREFKLAQADASRAARRTQAGSSKQLSARSSSRSSSGLFSLSSSRAPAVQLTSGGRVEASHSVLASV